MLARIQFDQHVVFYRDPAGDRKGRWSIRINDQWRICFHFEAGNAHDVEVVDYH